MPQKKLSVIITCYNDHQYIEEAVDSAQAQTWGNKEIIVIDDGSNERTKAKLKQLQPKINLLITQTNRGVSQARNIGIEKAEGDYILILDSDDTFKAGFSQEAIKNLERDPHIKAVNSYAKWFKNENDFRIYKPEGGELTNFLNYNSGIGNCMMRKKDFLKVGGYDEKMLNGFEDWEFFLRLLNEGGRLHVIPKVLFNYRNRNGSRNKKAIRKKYELWQYIFIKHQEIYKKHFDVFIIEFLSAYKKNEEFKQQIIDSLDYSLGNKILKPVRKLGFFKK